MAKMITKEQYYKVKEYADFAEGIEGLNWREKRAYVMMKAKVCEKTAARVQLTDTYEHYLFVYYKEEMPFKFTNRMRIEQFIIEHMRKSTNELFAWWIEKHNFIEQCEKVLCRDCKAMNEGKCKNPDSDDPDICGIEHWLDDEVR